MHSTGLANIPKVLKVNLFPTPDGMSCLSFPTPTFLFREKQSLNSFPLVVGGSLWQNQK